LSRQQFAAIRRFIQGAATTVPLPPLLHKTVSTHYALSSAPSFEVGVIQDLLLDTASQRPRSASGEIE
jgi:hypothetical protein